MWKKLKTLLLFNIDNPFFAARSTPGGLAINNLDEWDVNGHLGADLLSEAEKRLCTEIKVLPAHYLNMLEKLSIEVLNGHIAQKSDAHRIFR
ncbi:transcriptional adapter ADA2 [Artemisia annua]|uniref:Transcriptional adapter ADA2 n=1 Tax=Artemisia annua TaxID=35608 RepID=A0A2U1LB42_ARTAN|nr:transcriptional adapter ADA2 [Artemisia annua]